MEKPALPAKKANGNVEVLTAAEAAVEAAARAREKILFEVQPVLLPTILNIENLTLIGFTLIILIITFIFHLGLSEILIIAALYLILALPSFYSIFRAGSTTYVLTTRRLVIFSVLSRTRERSIPLEEIQNVKCKYSGLQRLYGAGDIHVSRKGLRSTVKLLGLKNCKKMADQIEQAVRKTQG